MFGKKELQRELEQKEQQIQELNRRIKEYQDKNDAVVSALTDAKSAANRIIGAAEAKRDDIIAAAMREKAGMEAQRDGILDEARAQAAAIVADAEKRAKAAEEQARYFQDYIRNTADTVRRQAENYAGFLENYENIGVGQQPETEKIDTPDEYREGLYVGYRYYETANKAVRYPFGYGLSYTTFAYSDLKVNAEKVTFTLTNTGSVAGAEIAQLYVAKPDAAVFRPAKELKGFTKVFLKAGESKTVAIPLDDKTFRYWNVATDCWEVEGGSYQLLVGANVQDIRLTAEITLPGTGAPDPYAGKDLAHYRTAHVQEVSDAEFEALLGRPLPEETTAIDRTMTLGELNHSRSPLCWLIAGVLTLLVRSGEKNGKPNLNILFQYNMPLRGLAQMTGGIIGEETVDGLVMEAKGFWVIGILRALVGLLQNFVANSRYQAKLDEQSR